MTQEASQCTFAPASSSPSSPSSSFNFSCDKSAEKALATSSNSSISKSSHSEDDASPSYHHTASVQTSQNNPKIKSSQLVKEATEKSAQNVPIIAARAASEARRTPSNVSNKSVTFCLKYMYAWYPPAVDIDLVSFAHLNTSCPFAQSKLFRVAQARGEEQVHATLTC